MKIIEMKEKIHAKDIQKNALQQDKLLNIAHELSSSLELQFILDKIIEQILELLDSKGATIYLLDSKKQFLEPVVTNDIPYEAQIMSQKVNIKSSLSGNVVESKKGMIFNNASQNLDAYQIQGTSADEDEHLLVLPILDDEEILGTMNVYRREKLYGKEDVALAETFAVYASTAIQNAQAHQNLIREIEVRKQTEKSLKSSEERLKIIFESAPDTYYLNDLKGNFIDGNKAAEVLTGYKREELIGKSFLKLNLLSVKDIPRAAKALVKSVLGKATGPDEYTLKRKDGSKVSVEVLSYPVKIEGKPIILGIARDITERNKAQEILKASEEKYRSLSEELNESNSMKELLLDVIAHDLRNPACVIKGFTEIALENDPKNKILDEIRLGTDNLLAVIANATILSKVTIGDTIDKEELDLTNLINMIIDENLPHLQLAEMTIEMKINEEIIVEANPIIGEVFRNYISNAIKYAKTGKKVVIDANFRNGDVTINFKDYGETIENKNRENIFLRNVQLDKTKGRGLGLAIVKRIATAHDAEVGVKPNKPKGNNFYIKIPVE
jgi:PAS domain S-box-containing protein